MIIYSNGECDLTNLKRKPEVEKAYQEHLEKLKLAHRTPEQWILENIAIHGQNGRWLTLNEFPYDVPYIHYLLWVKDYNLIIPFDTSDPDLVAIFVNDTQNQSVKGVKHYHIFKKVAT